MWTPPGGMPSWWQPQGVGQPQRRMGPGSQQPAPQVPQQGGPPQSEQLLQETVMPDRARPPQQSYAEAAVMPQRGGWMPRQGGGLPIPGQFPMIGPPGMGMPGGFQMPYGRPSKYGQPIQDASRYRDQGGTTGLYRQPHGSPADNFYGGQQRTDGATHQMITGFYQGPTDRSFNAIPQPMEFQPQGPMEQFGGMDRQRLMALFMRQFGQG